MTFIASVVAQKGVAIVADSLVTTMEKVMSFDTFRAWYKTVTNANIDGINGLKELSSLFQSKAVHTSNYEEKIFEYDRYTAITIAGSVMINGLHIRQLLDKLIHRNKRDQRYNSKDVETKVNELCLFLNAQVAKHVKRFGGIESTLLIFTHYQKDEEQTVIYKVEIEAVSNYEIDDESHSWVSFTRTPDSHKVVCGGQTGITRRILFGNKDALNRIIPDIIYLAIDNLGIERENVQSQYITRFMKGIDLLLTKQFYTDMKIHRLTDLSLQQAVDLAALLMKVEMDFQEYTEKIPVVGGLVKLAVIDKEGFRFITGHHISKPKYLN